MEPSAYEVNRVLTHPVVAPVAAESVSMTDVGAAAGSALNTGPLTSTRTPESVWTTGTDSESHSAATTL